jgi:acyl dehydratase
MLEVERAGDLSALVGQEIGVSDWLTVDQRMIDTFAEATGDHQWIHVDVERAARELPGGHTIAHGFLTLSLVPMLSHKLWSVRQRSRGLNYGSNKVRFTAPVPSGSRIRLRQRLAALDPVEGNGHRLTMESTVEIEGSERPALVAEILSIIYD